ncbi:MAG: CapA family protein [Parcubacteria group bacterium]|nr:CapA family protein [Parcubacteria group bacterium]
MTRRYIGGVLGILVVFSGGFWVWGSGGAGGGVGDTRAIASKEQKSVLEEPEPIRMLFVGDMMFDRHVRKMVDVYGWEHIFSCVDDFLNDFDMVVGNLEGPITAYESVSVGTEPGSRDNYVFTFPPETARLLAQHNIGIVSIANNHIRNFGYEGEEETKKRLNEVGVGYMSNDKPVYREGNVSLVAFNIFSGMSANEIALKIQEEKKAGQTVIVYAHWGEEYSKSVASMQSLAQTFVESGADIIIGSHPHIVIPKEEIGSVPVYYSLGNFIFDQYFSDDVRHGLALGVEIVEDDISLTEYPVEMFPDGRTCMFE